MHTHGHGHGGAEATESNSLADSRRKEEWGRNRTKFECMGGGVERGEERETERERERKHPSRLIVNSRVHSERVGE